MNDVSALYIKNTSSPSQMMHKIRILDIMRVTSLGLRICTLKDEHLSVA